MNVGNSFGWSEGIPGDSWETFCVGIQPGYSPLCKNADKVMAKNAMSPVVLLVDGEVIGVIMPVRL